MLKPPSQMTVLAAGVIALVAVGMVLLKKKESFHMQDAAAGATGAVLGVADDVVSGVVLGIGDVIGIPRTDHDACQKAIADGDIWGRLTKCTAGEFTSSIFSPSTPVPTPTQVKKPAQQPEPEYDPNPYSI